MNTDSPACDEVVVATDGSADADLAIDWAAQEAATRTAPLRILTAYPYGDAASDEPGAASQARQIVDSAAARVRQGFPGLSIRTEVAQGDPRRLLEASQDGAAVVVLGSRGRNALRTVWLGSVSYWATRHLEVPAVIVRPLPGAQRVASRNLVVGVDVGDSGVALSTAFAMAARRNASVTVAHGWWDVVDQGTPWHPVDPSGVDAGQRQMLDDLLAPIVAEYPNVPFAIVFARGNVVAFLLDLARTHEALVIGRKRVAPFDSLGLGTVATSVVEHAFGVTVVVPMSERILRGEEHGHDVFVTAQERLWVGGPVDSDDRTQLANQGTPH